MTAVESQALVPVEVRAVASVFGTDDPQQIVSLVQQKARALGDAIKQGNMSTKIQGREYVLAEGWAFLGSMLGVFPRTVRVDAMATSADDPDPIGYEAHVELVTRDGSVVGGAVAECSRLETAWADRAPYALKSMAQTRATGKAYRMAFGFVMKAAGYEATPAEEMPETSERNAAPPSTVKRTTNPADLWIEGAHKFVAKACEAYGLKEEDVFRILEVANGDELIDKAKDAESGWISLATQLKTAIEEMPF